MIFHKSYSTIAQSNLNIGRDFGKYDISIEDEEETVFLIRKIKTSYVVLYIGDGLYIRDIFTQGSSWWCYLFSTSEE